MHCTARLARAADLAEDSKQREQQLAALFFTDLVLLAGARRWYDYWWITMNRATKLVLVVAVGFAAAGYFSFLSAVWPSGSGVGGAIWPPHPRPDVTVESGTVAAYGRPLTPPYRIQYSDGDITINGIVYRTMRAKPDVGPAATIPEETRQKDRLMKEIVERYVEVYRLYGEERAVAQILGEFEGRPLVASLQATGTTLTIHWSDGRNESVMLHTATMDYPSAAEIEKQFASNVGSLVGVLENGGGIIFGEGYEVLLPSRSANEFLAKVSQLADRNTSAQEARDELVATLSSREAAADIAANLAAWRGRPTSTPSPEREVAEAVYEEGGFSPCPSWRITVSSRDGGYFRNRNCPEKPALSISKQDISADEFSRYVYVDAYLRAAPEMGREYAQVPVPAYREDVAAQISRCYLSSDKVSTVCANSWGVIVTHEERPSVLGMQDGDFGRVLKFIRYAPPS